MDELFWFLNNDRQFDFSLTMIYRCALIPPLYNTFLFFFFFDFVVIIFFFMSLVFDRRQKLE